MPHAASRLSNIGVVLIGRNEGARLELCLDSIPEDVGGVVYVDSGSTDGSADLARSRNVEVVTLDMAKPFTAARARNSGFEALMKHSPQLVCTQFVDGDCSLADGWLETAAAAMDEHPDWAGLCGFRRERFPTRTIYNHACELEWTTPPLGEVGKTGIGGDVMIRVSEFRKVGGYDASLIAGEDPDLSARLHEIGGEVVRIDLDMTHHDADIQDFSQWWARSVRSGHAYAEIASRHHEGGLFQRNLRSTIVWGGLLPATAAVFAPWNPTILFAIGLLYLVQIFRVARGMDPDRFPGRDRIIWGLSCMATQIPKMYGVLRFEWNRLLGRRSALIEYK